MNANILHLTCLVREKLDEIDKMCKEANTPGAATAQLNVNAIVAAEQLTSAAQAVAKAITGG